MSAIIGTLFLILGLIAIIAALVLICICLTEDAALELAGSILIGVLGVLMITGSVCITKLETKIEFYEKEIPMEQTYDYLKFMEKRATQ